MSIVISNSKHYAGLASKIRSVLGTDVEYKPSEMPSAIASMQTLVDECDAIENGVIYRGDNSEIRGSTMYPGTFANYDIRNFVVPENVTSLPAYAFSRSTIENITLHDNITSIGKFCFYCAENLTNIHFPENLRSIGESAFQATGLTGKIVLPSSVTTLDLYAFAGNDGITSIDVPSGVHALTKQVFGLSDNLETVILRSTTVCSLADYALWSTRIEEGTGYVYVPASIVDSYKTSSAWTEYASQIRAIEDYPDICG